MLAARITPVFDWLADVYVLSTIWLVAGLAARLLLTQPARRMAIARSLAAGLVVLAMLAVTPRWPQMTAVRWTLSESKIRVALRGPGNQCGCCSRRVSGGEAGERRHRPTGSTGDGYCSESIDRAGVTDGFPPLYPLLMAIRFWSSF